LKRQIDTVLTVREFTISTSIPVFGL